MTAPTYADLPALLDAALAKPEGDGYTRTYTMPIRDFVPPPGPRLESVAFEIRGDEWATTSTWVAQRRWRQALRVRRMWDRYVS